MPKAEDNFHILTPLRLETNASQIFLYGQGEFVPFIQVESLNIIGSSNMHTATYWLTLC